MAPITAANASSIAELVKERPSIKIYTSDSSNFASIRAFPVVYPEKVPYAVVRPQSVEDVQAIIRFVAEHNIDYTIRTGGHDCPGRSQIKDGLIVDLRDINSVEVDSSKTTARIGGGALFGQVQKVLGEHGLVTPCGSISGVGYVGWATLGGYGLFSSLYGLGVDQIVGAKLVTATGELIECTEEMLKGIRGGGGCFGVIVEVTTKVYPLKQLLSGFLVYESSDIKATWTTVTQRLQALIDAQSLPKELQVQVFGFYLPDAGRVMAVWATWVSDDHDLGLQWIDKIAALGTCILNDTKPTTMVDWVEANQKMLQGGITGGVRTLNIKRWTTNTAEIFAKHNLTFPGAGMGLSIHTLRTQAENEASVFPSRHGHIMVEVMAGSTDHTMASEWVAWADAVIQDLRNNDPENVLESRYVSLVDEERPDYKKIYGKHYDVLLDLKRKFDPKNVFKTSVPQLIPEGH